MALAAFGLQIQQLFSWPAENESAFRDKLEDMVNQTLRKVAEFLLVSASNEPGGVTLNLCQLVK
jgi:hypothetical protein